MRMVTRVPDVTRLVDRLESAGLVDRTRSESDRRVVLVRIGKKGLELLAGIDEPMKRMPDKLMGGLGAAELRKLNDLLVRLRGAQD
jgi:DNA-binding MarR family transcriptional regulator